MITQSKLAKLANVSVSTISKAFSMSSEVNEETREHIFNIARKYDCFKKFYSAKYPKYVVAVICPEFKSTGFTRILEALQTHFSENKCDICVAATKFSAVTELELLEYYVNYVKVDAVILFYDKIQIPDYVDIPVVRMFCRTTSNKNNVISATVNYKDAFIKTLYEFKKKGITDIGFIGETFTDNKQLIFEEAMRELSIPLKEEFISVVSERFERGGYEATKRFFQNKKLPKLIFCAYDYMAYGALRCVIDHGLKIPEDIEIMGIDNMPQSEYTVPSITSMSYNENIFCAEVVKTVFKMMAGEECSENISATLRLCKRESTTI